VGGSRVLQNLAITQNISSIRDLNKRGTPQSALILCAIFSAALLFISNQFDELAIISVVTTLIPYLFVGASALLLFPSWRYRTIACFSMGMTLGILLLSIIAVI
jgi:amino acid transporter